MLGLHFGGDAEGSAGEFALACYAQSVFEKLELEPLGAGPSAPSVGAVSIEAAEALRLGFDAAFLDFTVPRPKFTRATVKDLIGLQGGDWIDYCHFTVWLSKSRRLPRCVAWNIDGATKKRLGRKGLTFTKDSRDGLEAFQFGDELYAGNDLDRGHVARRDDLVWGELAEARQANLDSFHFTNMAPQHRAFNQSQLKGQWGQLENAILDEVDLKDLRVSVFAGPVLAGIDMPYRGAQLPSEFWKIVFYVDDADGQPKARAFILTQKDLLKTIQPESLELSEFRWYQVPLSRIERKTGLRFGAAMHALDTRFPQALAMEPARLIQNGAFFE
jgi:endonuclease G